MMSSKRKRKIVAADLFCGAGGTSTGLVRACHKMGIDVDLLAVNHWPVAIATHTKNHPNAQHICARLDQIRPEDFIKGGRLHLLVASPECTHHSKARGGKPMNDQSRATGWDVLNWVSRLTVDNIILENVKEWQDWGPLDTNGRPLKSKKGATFRAFIESLRGMGYRVEWRVLNAANYGDATTRERLFVIARRGNKKIVWPEPTHAPAEQVGQLFGEKQAWKPARDIIDWSIPGKSIFNRKKPLAPATMKRIEAGLRKFGGKNAEPFLVILKNNQTAQSVNEPVGTITTVPHLALCEPFVLGQQSGSAPRSVDDPIPTVATDGAIALVEPFVVTVDRPETNRSIPRSTDDPLPTITGSPRIGIVEPFIVPQFGEAQPKPVTDPLGTITTTSRGIGLCEPYLVTVNHGEGDTRRTHSIDGPLPTVTTKNGLAVVEPFLLPHPHPNDLTTDSIDKPIRTITGTSSDFALVQPFLLSIDHQGGNGDQVRQIDQPMPTVTTKARTGVVEPFLVPFFGERDGQEPRTHSVDDPLPTVTGHGAGAVVEPYLVEFYGNGGAQSVDEPLPTVTTKDRFGLVTIDGTQYKVDIRFRMLQPHELAAAMGFPEGYEFTGNREAIVKQIGNAVPGNLSEALVSSILAEAA